jgi:thymidylate synthase
MVSAWNVGELGEVVLPPCHYGFQCYTHELSYKERYKIWFRNNYETGMEYNSDSIPNFEDEYYTPTPKRTLSLMWNQRSVDTFLGLPFNIASYGTLLQLIADECNMIAGELIGNLGDTHLYKNHIQQAKEQILRSSFKLPTIKLSNVDILSGEWDYEIEGYEYHPTIKAPLSN